MRKRILATTLVLMMAIYGITAFAAQPTAADNGTVYTFLDTFTDGFDQNWENNGKNEFGAANPYCDVATINNRSNGLTQTYTATWLNISTNSYWYSYDKFPGMRYKGKIPMASVQNISFKANFDRETGIGVRFMIHNGGKNYYELYTPRSDIHTPYILSKVVNGNRSVLKEFDPTEFGLEVGGSYDITPFDLTNYNITARPDTGEIKFDISSGQYTVGGGENIKPAARFMQNNYETYKNIETTVIDPNPFEVESDCSIELIGAGQGNRFVKYTDVNVTATRYPTIATLPSEIYSDTFETYSATGVAPSAPGTVLNSNWKAHDGMMGWEGSDTEPEKYAAIGIASELGSGSNNAVNTNQGSISGNVLSIQAKADSNYPNVFPTVVYTGEYPQTKGYEISLKMIAGNGGGIRFAADDSFSNYYELFIRGNEQVKISKVTDGVREVLYTQTSHDGSYNAATGAMPIWGNVYNVNLRVYNGKISYSLNTIGNGNVIMNSPIIYVDKNMPISTGKVALFAAGDQGCYTRFDDFSISSYDEYTNDKTEPSAVLYRNAAYGITPDSNGIITLPDEVTVRKVALSNATGDSTVEVSQDNENYYSLGTVANGSVINIKSAAKFKYVKVPVGAAAKVYTEANDDVISAPLYSTIELVLVSDGVEIDPIDMSFSDNDNGSIAYDNYDKTYYIKGKANSNTKWTFGIDDVSASAVVSVASPYIVTDSGNSVTAKVYVDKDIDLAQGAIGIISMYDDNNNLISVDSAAAVINGNVATFTVTSNSAATKVKAMLWKSLNTAIPVAEAYQVR